jgi:hypothetical protein
MDSDDITHLKEALERAEKKAASLKMLLQSKNLTQMPSLSEAR